MEQALRNCRGLLRFGCLQFTIGPDLTHNRWIKNICVRSQKTHVGGSISIRIASVLSKQSLWTSRMSVMKERTVKNDPNGNWVPKYPDIKSLKDLMEDCRIFQVSIRCSKEWCFFHCHAAQSSHPSHNSRKKAKKARDMSLMLSLLHHRGPS
jgi:hypothetical protein